MSLFARLKNPKPSPALARLAEEYAAARMNPVCSEPQVKYSAREGASTRIRHALPTDLAQSDAPAAETSAARTGSPPRVRFSIISPQSVTERIDRTLSAPSPDVRALKTVLDSVKKPTFSETVQRHLQERGMKSSEVYNRIGMDRRHFSKILADPQYHPARDTAIALALGLRLPLKEAGELLSAAGFSLSASSRRDMVVEYFFAKERWDLIALNDVLFTLGEKTIGV